MINKKFIQNFENQIAKLYAKGKIKAPIHLRSGREDKLISIFHNINKNDWVFGYWDSHDLALLKGVPPSKLKKAILEGRSISLCFPSHRLYCSGIVGSLMGVAVGVAWAIKQLGKKDKVYLFCGDMSAETGIFHEAIKYSYNWDLPIKFIIADNGVSVTTPTREVWGSDFISHVLPPYNDNIIYFTYENGYPHSGIGQRIAF